MSIANPQDPAQGDWTYAYGDGGNVVQRQVEGWDQTFSYDQQQRVVQVDDVAINGVGNTATTTFAYTAGDSRVVRDTDEAQTFYAFGVYEYEIDKATDARTERSTYLVAGERVAVRSQVSNPASDELTWTFADNLGSASGFLNETTGEAGAQRYYPFGHQRVGSATDVNPTDHGYTGQIRDGATGVYFYNARYYDQHTGRFLAADTIIPNPANPADLNRYSYVRNNPINYNDPTGHCPSNSECYEEAMRYVAGAPSLSGCSETAGYDVGCRVSVDGQTVGFIGYVENVTGNGAGDVLHFFDSCNPVGGFASVSDCRVEFDWGIATGIVAGLGCTAAAGGTIASGGLAGGAAVFACGAAAAAVGTVTSNVQYGRSWHTNVARNAIIGGVADLLLFGGGRLIGGRLIANHLCSFAGETEVLMADGTTKPISEIEIGDWVLAEDPETGEQGARQVTHLWTHQDTIIDLEIDGIDIATTPDHPFWNATDFEWQRAEELDEGDFLLTAESNVLSVAGIDWTSIRQATAYNLTVDDIHTYFVDVDGSSVLVHNVCPTRSNYRSLFFGQNPSTPSSHQVHHALPQKYHETMEAVGINIHEMQFLRGVDPDTHRQITNLWKNWDRSLGRTPTAQDVTDFSYVIDEMFGNQFVFGS